MRSGVGGVRKSGDGLWGWELSRAAGAGNSKPGQARSGWPLKTQRASAHVPATTQEQGGMEQARGGQGRQAGGS